MERLIHVGYVYKFRYFLSPRPPSRVSVTDVSFVVNLPRASRRSYRVAAATTGVPYGSCPWTTIPLWNLCSRWPTTTASHVSYTVKNFPPVKFMVAGRGGELLVALINAPHCWKFTVVPWRAQLTRDLSAIAKFLNLWVEARRERSRGRWRKRRLYWISPTTWCRPNDTWKDNTEDSACHMTLNDIADDIQDNSGERDGGSIYGCIGRRTCNSHGRFS